MNNRIGNWRVYTDPLIANSSTGPAPASADHRFLAPGETTRVGDEAWIRDFERWEEGECVWQPIVVGGRVIEAGVCVRRALSAVERLGDLV